MVSLESQKLLEESESMENEFEHFSNNLKNNQHCHSLLLERKEVYFTKLYLKFNFFFVIFLLDLCLKIKSKLKLFL